MRLAQYLCDQGESGNAFAKRAGISQSTVNKLTRGKGASLGVALRIREITEGAVALSDLLPEGVSPARAVVQDMRDIGLELRRRFPEVFAPRGEPEIPPERSQDGPGEPIGVADADQDPGPARRPARRIFPDLTPEG